MSRTEALTLVPTRLLDTAAKLLNTPGDTLGSCRDLLREIVGAAQPETKETTKHD